MGALLRRWRTRQTILDNLLMKVLILMKEVVTEPPLLRLMLFSSPPSNR
jgi:hypothetical protein